MIVYWPNPIFDQNKPLDTTTITPNVDSDMA